MESDNKVMAVKHDFNTLLQIFSSRDQLVSPGVGVDASGKPRRATDPKRFQSKPSNQSFTSQSPPNNEISSSPTPSQQTQQQQQQQANGITNFAPSTPQKQTETNNNHTVPESRSFTDSPVDQHESTVSLLLQTEQFMHELQIENEEDISKKLLSQNKLPPQSMVHEPSIKIPILNLALPETPVLQQPNSVHETIKPQFEPLILVLDVLCSFLPTFKYPSSRMALLELFLRFSNHLDSEIRLQRIVPHVVSLLTKEDALVRSTAIKVLTQVVCFLCDVFDVLMILFLFD